MRLPFRVGLAGALVLLVGVFVHRARSVGGLERTDAPELTTAPRAASPAEAPEYVGVVLSERTVDVVARVEGLVAEMVVKLGDRVEAGQTIARIEVPKLHSQIDAAVAATQGIEVAKLRAEAEAGEAERVMHYKETLHAESVGSKAEVDAARYEAKVAALRVAEANAKLTEQRGRLQELKRDLEATTVKAPVAGIIAVRYVGTGGSAAALQKLVRIVGDGRPLVRFAVPQGDLAKIPIGGEVVAVGKASGVRVRARVVAVAPEVDPAANMLFVEAEVIEAGESAHWRSGELVHVGPASRGG